MGDASGNPVNIDLKSPYNYNFIYYLMSIKVKNINSNFLREVIIWNG